MSEAQTEILKMQAKAHAAVELSRLNELPEFFTPKQHDLVAALLASAYCQGMIDGIKRLQNG